MMEGTYRYAPFHLVPAYLDQGWEWCGILPGTHGFFSALVRLPFDYAGAA